MTSTQRRPNILLIQTDQHESSVAGFAGDPYVQTQHLDAFAQRSIQFDTAICPSPICTPSRMCMLTGKEAHRCAAWSNHWIIFPEHVTWPGHFADHGYRTCLVGKMHFGGRDQMQGFQVRPYGDLRHGLSHQPEPIDLFPAYHSAESAGVTEIPESLLQDVVVTRESLAFLLEHQDVEPDVPWFVCASYSRPHCPFTAPGRYIRRYRDKIPAAFVPTNPNEDLEPFARRYFSVDQPSEVSLRGREAYYACVDFVDDCIGELLEGLNRAGLLDNTIVIYTSDHGEMIGHHGIWGKIVYYESSVGVPLLMTGPGIRAGHHRVAHPVSLLDLFPTTCGLAGLPIPEGLDGVDLHELLADPETAKPPRDFAASASFAYGVRINYNTTDENQAGAAMRLVRDQNWKYVEIEKGSPLLFDLANDPLEKLNLAARAEHQERCRQMKQALFRDFSWQHVHEQLAIDRARLPEFLSGQRPSTPNQYVLADGRVFDAEGDLYGARWLYVPLKASGGIIPQQFG